MIINKTPAEYFFAFRKLLKRIFVPLGLVIAFVVDASQFIELMRGNRATVTVLVACVSYFAFIGLLAYVAFGKVKSRLYTNAGNLNYALRYPKLYKPARIGLVSVVVLTLIPLGLLYWQTQLARGKVIVLVADFGGDDPNKYRVTEQVLLQLRQSVSGYNDTIIRSLGKTITEQQGVEEARARGRDYKAALVLWGYYGVTSSDVLLTVHVENLSRLKRLPISDSKIYAAKAAVSEFNSFKFQQRLSQEMSAFTLFVSALIRLEAKDSSEAVRRLTAALNVGEWPEDLITKSVLYLSRGIAFALSEDYTRALADCSEALKINPQYAEAYNIRAMALTKLDRFQDAISDYSKAIELNPQNASVYHNRGLTYLFSKKNYQNALTDYDHAIGIDPEEPLYYYGRGLAFTFLKERQKAISDFSRTIKMTPNDSAAYYYRGLNYIDVEKCQDAIQDLSRAIQIDPGSSANYLVRGMAYLCAKNYQQALNESTQAIKIDPQSDVAYGFRGSVFSSLHKYEEALADLQTALKVSKNEELRQLVDRQIQALQQVRQKEEELDKLKESLRRLREEEEQTRQGKQ